MLVLIASFQDLYLKCVLSSIFRILPSAMVIAFIVLGDLLTSLTNNTKGKFSMPRAIVLLDHIYGFCIFLILP